MSDWPNCEVCLERPTDTFDEDRQLYVCEECANE